MITYKLVEKKVTDKTFCDVCGKNCTDDMGNHENATLEATWGYSSHSDGLQFTIHICENCFYDTVAFLRNKRSLYRPVIPNDPFEGKSYFPS